MADRHDPGTWLYPTERGLYCAAGDFHIDPVRPVARAVITHAHSDHARPDNAAVLATADTLGLMRVRYGERAGASLQAAEYGETLTVGGVAVTLRPAGHVLGSAQVEIVKDGFRAVVSGDYKRAQDPTCTSFESIRCDLLVTEATFGLPVFRHEPAEREAARLLRSVAASGGRSHLVGVYGLGKCQRLIALLRQAGYGRPLYLHGALEATCAYYRERGIDLGELAWVGDRGPAELAGEIVLCPPSALADRWSRRLADPVTAFASGWMRVRGRARQRGIELPLVISDHADWPELIATIAESGAGEIWVTHGREDALLHQIAAMGRRGRALRLVGFEDEGE